VKRTTILQVTAGLCIAGLGIWVFTRQVNIQEMAREIRQVPIWKIVVVILFNPGTLFFRAWRWRYLLHDKKNCSKSGLFPLVCIGFMVNNFIPARLGEAVRAGLLWRRNGFTIAESVGSILVERMLDVFGYMIFLIVPIFLLQNLESQKVYGMPLAAGVVLIIGLLLLYVVFPGLMKKPAAYAAGWLPEKLRRPVVKITREIVSNLDWIYSLRKTAAVAVLTFCTLWCQVVMVRVLGIGIPGFKWLESMFEIALAAIGAAIPLSPGYVGTLHASMMHGMDLLALPPDKAGAVVILYHALGYVTIAALGLFFFFWLRISLSDIRNAGGNATQS
jgi:glycosyltransferase 2 family protein